LARHFVLQAGRFSQTALEASSPTELLRLRLTSPLYPPNMATQCPRPPNRVENLPRSCWIAQLNSRFDPVAEESEFSDHFRGAALRRVSAHRWAPFVVTDSLVQNQPDEPTKPITNCANGLIVSQARHQAGYTISKMLPLCLTAARGLIENASHVAVALRGTVAPAYSRALVVSRHDPTQEERFLAEGKVAALAPTSAMICCAESAPRPGTSASRSTAS
jgi:hypothetical protein